MEVEDLPPVSAFGALEGRDAFRALCRRLFARPDVRFVRNARGDAVVFRHRHLRELGASPAAGNLPPDLIAGGSYDAVRDPAAAPPGAGAEVARVVANQVFTMNAPLHGAARRILTAQLTPRTVAGMAALADRVVADLARDLAGRGACDFQTGFANRLTARFWGALIGMAPDASEETAALVHRMHPLFFGDASAEEVADVDLAAAGYHQNIRRAVRGSAVEGGPALVTGVAAALRGLETIDDPARCGVTPADAGGFLAGNLIDAYHTAALGVGGAVLALLSHPDALSALRADPGRLAAAAAEVLRWEPPVLHLDRYALEEIGIDGLRIRPGRRIVMAWAAGDFDPEVFEDPFTFDMDRPARPATTFGAGAQICPGRLAAAMLVQRTLKAVAERTLDVALQREGDVAWLERSSMAQMREMRVVFAASPSSPA